MAGRRGRSLAFRAGDEVPGARVTRIRGRRLAQRAAGAVRLGRPPPGTEEGSCFEESSSLSFALCAIPALADEGRIPIPFSSPGTPPIIITQPGKYILTRNLRATAAGSCIQLAVPAGTPGDVDIDLNQNTARGNAGAGACGGPCGVGTDFCNGGVGNSSNGDNWLPVAPCL